MFLKVTKGRSLLQIDATMCVGAIMSLGFQLIRTQYVGLLLDSPHLTFLYRLEAIFQVPLTDVGVRERAALYIAKAFPYDGEIQQWARGHEKPESVDEACDSKMALEDMNTKTVDLQSKTIVVEKENTAQRVKLESRPPKRSVIEVIDLTDSPERPAKRQKGQ